MTEFNNPNTPDSTGTPVSIKAIQACLDIYNQLDPFGMLLVSTALVFGLFDRDGKDTETCADDGKDAETCANDGNDFEINLLNNFKDAYRALPAYERALLSMVVGNAPLGAKIKISDKPFPVEEKKSDNTGTPGLAITTASTELEFFQSLYNDLTHYERFLVAEAIANDLPPQDMEGIPSPSVVTCKEAYDGLSDIEQFVVFVAIASVDPGDMIFIGEVHPSKGENA